MFIMNINLLYNDMLYSHQIEKHFLGKVEALLYNSPGRRRVTLFKGAKT